jgi:zinc protease
MRAELLRLGEAPPEPDELAARKALMLGSFARRFETTSGLAALLATQVAQGRPLAALARYGDEVQAVSPEQVRDFAARHWVADTLHGVIVGDTRAAGAAGTDTLRLTLPTLNLDSPTLQR